MSNKCSRFTLLMSIVLSCFSSYSNATIVQFQTVLGNFEVNLYDETTIETVANFLEYVESDAYEESVIHRSIDGFIIQGGGFIFNQEVPLDSVVENAPVTNEPFFSNIRGTIAMAKLAGNPNSATNEWFFNLSDNSTNLDLQNGGFTVFGEVMGEGMAVVDAIADLPEFNFNSVLTDTPMRDYTEDDFDNEVLPERDNFVVITDIVVIDAALDTASDLTPTPNTLILPTPTDPGDGSNNGSGGGAFIFELFGLLGLFVIAIARTFSASRMKK